MLPYQCRAARALLNWTQTDLAKKAGVAVSTVADFERQSRQPINNNVRAMQRALEEAGVHWVLAGAALEAQ